MSSLKLLLLGQPHFERDGQPLKFDTRKNLALVAYMALTKRRHSRETLLTLPTDVVITLNEEGLCRFAVDDATATYDSMSESCDNEDARTIVCTLEGLEEGSYGVYIACADVVGNVDYAEAAEGYQGNTGGFSVSAETKRLIEQEVKRLIDEGYETARRILLERSEEFERLAQGVLE